MTKLFQDLIGAVYDFVKFILSCLFYFYKGVIIVGVPLILIALLFEFIYK